MALRSGALWLETRYICKVPSFYKRPLVTARVNAAGRRYIVLNN
jgi:hypothetical protein